jgi:hypothetical protein
MLVGCLQVEVLHHVSTGVSWSTGRISSWNSQLMQGFAGWVSADDSGECKRYATATTWQVQKPAHTGVCAE